MTTNNDLITSTHLLTESDIQEHAVIERWRSIEKDREEQLKSPKHRFSMADQCTLTQQMHDKILEDVNEEKLSNAYARDSARHETIAQLLEIRQEHDRRSLAQDLNEFRAAYQQPKDAREYDLNDSLMSTIVYDHDGDRLQYGPGSCLVFQGEDRNRQDREKIQKHQMNQWITEQCDLKYDAIKEQQILGQAYDCNQRMVLERIKSLEKAQMIRRRQLEKDITAFNRNLANQKRCQQNVKEACELEDKQQEMENMRVDEMLATSPNHTRSQFGPRRPLLPH